MVEAKLNMHYFATRDEFRKVLARQKRFFPADCGFRKWSEKGFARSRMDVCPGLHEGATSGGARVACCCARTVTR